ncbi:uncharacterized protein [Venturia canescens]|uniref:uncharacterized protein n=1 Tax=Venturia canescens TaxID=32260 RepID=UPI001C9CCB3B|nr:uncharacterized protein LOC122415259 [Venturia canescens]
MGNSCFQYSGRSLSILHSSNDIQSPAYIIQSAEQARRNGEIAAENARKEARALQNLLRNQQNAIEREAQRAVAEAQNMAANLRNSFAVNFPPNFPFNGASRPPFDFYNQGSWYRSKRTAGNDVGCGFLVRNVYGNMEHKLLCYFG